MSIDPPDQPGSIGHISIEPTAHIHLVCRRSGDGVMIEFAQDSAGYHWHIDSLPTPVPDILKCPACGQKVHPVRGKHVAYHFRHQSRTDCERAGETIAHRLAKQFIEEALHLDLPPVVVNGLIGRETAYPAQTFKLTSVTLEKHLGDIVPDIIAEKDSHQILIEIRVTHAVDDKKRRKIKNRNIAALEIDLSGIARGASVDRIRRAVLSDAPRHWVHNPKAVEATARKKERDEARLKDLSTSFKRQHLYKRRDIAEKLDASRQELHRVGLESLLRPNKILDGAFTGRPVDWRVYLLADILQLDPLARTASKEANDGHRTVEISAALKALRNAGFVKTAFGCPLDNEIHAAASLGLSINSAWRAIEAWFEALRAAKILSYSTMTGRAWTILCDAPELRDAVGKLEGAFTDLVTVHRYAVASTPAFYLRADGDPVEVSQDAWLQAVKSLSPQNSEIGRFIRALREASTCCRPPYRRPDGEMLEQTGIEIDTAALDRLREEHLERERQERGGQIAVIARDSLGEQADEFLDAPQRRSLGGTMRAQAMRGEHGFDRVVRLIHEEKASNEAETALLTLARDAFGEEGAKEFINRESWSGETTLSRVRKRAREDDERAAANAVTAEQERRKRIEQDEADRASAREEQRNDNLKRLRDEFGLIRPEMFELFLTTQQPELGHKRPKEICDSSEGYERSARLARQMRKRRAF